jgi:SAM-dependent methyltransferase
VIDKEFYEQHKNFILRTAYDYNLSPGIRCKFDLILKNLNVQKRFSNALELGCSGDSFLLFYNYAACNSLLDLAVKPLHQYNLFKLNIHPVCADAVKLPYKNNNFDLIVALDVLEHLKYDISAIEEISRVLTPNGIAVITVPHRKKYYTQQDKIIGHYRRYEIKDLKKLFREYDLREVRTFGIYGQLMQISEIQGVRPDKTEKNLINLREKYKKSVVFRKFWKKFVDFSSKIMKIEATFLPIKRAMNVAMIFRKTI